MNIYIYSIIMMLAATSVSAASFITGGIAYDIIEGMSGRCEVSYNPEGGYSGKVEIPSKVEFGNVNYEVVGIGAYAFAGSYELTSVSLPITVTYFERNAFQSCTSLTEITLPDRTTSIGEQSFYGCTSLRNFKGEGVKEIGDAAFGNCSSLSIFTGNAMERIGDGAFRNCAELQAFTLPDGIMLGNGVFSGCSSLSSVTLPKKMTAIPEYTFSDCVALKKVVNSQAVAEIGDYAFNTCRSLQSFEFGSRITMIGKNAFSFCTDLVIDSISGENAELGAYAFTGCTSLQKLKLKGFVEIGEEAFANATSLQNIVMDPAINYIRDRAFRNCKALTFIGCYAFIPPFLSNTSFETEIYANAELSVLYNEGMLYRQTPPWSYFVRVTELPENDIMAVENIDSASSFECHDGVLSLSGAPGIVRLYTLHGAKIYEEKKREDNLLIPLPQKGMLLLNYNGRSVKVLAE